MESNEGYLSGLHLSLFWMQNKKVRLKIGKMPLGNWINLSNIHSKKSFGRFEREVVKGFRAFARIEYKGVFLRDARRASTSPTFLKKSFLKDLKGEVEYYSYSFQRGQKQTQQKGKIEMNKLFWNVLNGIFIESNEGYLSGLHLSLFWMQNKRVRLKIGKMPLGKLNQPLNNCFWEVFWKIWKRGCKGIPGIRPDRIQRVFLRDARRASTSPHSFKKSILQKRKRGRIQYSIIQLLFNSSNPKKKKEPS